MKRKPARERNDQQLLYGVNPIVEALRGGRAPREIIVAEGARDERLRELMTLAQGHNVSVRRVAKSVLDREAGNTHHQGVIARIDRPSYVDADELLESITARADAGDQPLVLLLDGIEDPHNLGAILRTAECAGVDGVFIPERRAAGLNETVAKASAGAVAHLQVSRVTNLSVLIRQLKERNLWVIGTAADAPTDYSAWDWTRPAAVVLGGEGAGLHRLVREHCDLLVRVPVYGKIDSLNVSVTAGIVLYEVVRQRLLQSRNPDAH